jgi:hypothetical protein
MKRCAKTLTSGLFVILRDFSDKALKWQFLDTRLRAFLVFFFGLSAAEELVDLLELLTKAVACLPL